MHNMKKFIQKIQRLGQRATELKEAVQRVPPKVAGIRNAVVLTGGQLRELGVQVQNSIAGLKADREDDLLNALREVNDSAGIIRQAGFELGGIDFELSPVQRLIVHLQRREDVRTAVLESLRDASSARPTVHALLTSLVRAEETADSVHMTDLEYHTLVIHIGPAPTVRLCWRPAPSLAQGANASVLATASTVPASPSEAPDRPSFFGENPPATDGFTSREAVAEDEPPSPASSEPPAPRTGPTPEPVRVVRPASPPPPPPREVIGKKEAPPVWNSDALQRFKTMPKASKYRR